MSKSTYIYCIHSKLIYFTIAHVIFPLHFLFQKHKHKKFLVFLGKRQTTAQESTQKTIQAHWFNSGQ